jgi:ABC-type amino acid transport system permease subunit
MPLNPCASRDPVSYKSIIAERSGAVELVYVELAGQHRSNMAVEIGVRYSNVSRLVVLSKALYFIIPCIVSSSSSTPNNLLLSSKDGIDFSAP